MIKNFETYINEDYFSKLANRKDNGIVRKENTPTELTEDFVRSFVRDDSAIFIKSITIREEDGKPIVDIDGSFFLRDNIEQIPFQFGIVTGSFACAHCKNLKSLKGCPKFVGKNFICDSCSSLTSLDGCPKEVGWTFSCVCCGKKFTEQEVESLCNVRIKIYV